MSKVILSNHSDFERYGWCEVAVPYYQWKDTPKDTWLRFEYDGGWWWANRGPNIGTESVLIFVFGQWDPHESKTGVVVSSPLEGPFNKFVPSDWVTDEITHIILHPRIVRPHETVGSIEHPFLELLEEGPVRQVWRRRVRLSESMLVFDQIAYLYSFQDAVKTEITFTCSDPSTTAIRESFEALEVISGEYFELDFREKWSLPAPVQEATNWKQTLATAQEKSLDDGQQLAFSGWLLCLPTDRNKISIGNPIHINRLLSLFSYISDGKTHQGPVVGCSTEWHRSYGPFQAVPFTEDATNKEEEIYSWKTYLETPGHLYEEIPWGLTKRPWQTGGQEDFGACKGTGVITLQAPSLIEKYRFIARSEAMRPYHNREVDGSPINFDNHPNWRTWSERTDTRQAHATDSLGKEMVGSGFPPPLEGTGYEAKDDQHCTMNNFAAALALTGSYQLRDIYFDKLQVDRAQYEDRMGAPRAIGRLFQTWAQMGRLLPEDQSVILEDHAKTRIHQVMKEWRGGKHNNPVKILASGKQPGMDGPAWIVWEHSIAVRGMWALRNVYPTLATYLDTLAYEVSKTITNYGVYHDGVRWRCCAGIAYPSDDEGVPLDPSNYFPGSPTVATADSFWDWIVPGIIVGLEVFDVGSEESNRAIDIVEQNRAFVDKWSTAEWHAVRQF